MNDTAVKAYWTRQWSERNPRVAPVKFAERPNGSLEGTVQKNVQGLQGNPVFDGLTTHVYTFEAGLIKTIDIELV